MSQSIPIVYIHKGYSWYLNYTFHQSLSLNPNSRHFIIGDENINKFSKAEFVSIDRYKDSALEFKKRYKHLSSNDPIIELFCFERWFYLRELMKEYKLDRVFTCDSDVMLFCDVTKEEEFEKRYLASLCIPFDQENYKLSASAHVSYWSYEGINEFCSFISSVYSSDQLPFEIETKWNGIVKNNTGGAISDMALLYLFSREKNINNLLEVRDGAVYDDNINFADNYVKNEFVFGDRIKQIVWKYGKPFGKLMNLQQEVRFKALHFQGVGKNRIQEFYKMNQGGLKAAKMKFEVKAKRIFRKLTGKQYK